LTGYSDRSIKVLEQAQNLAVQLGHNLIGSEHMLFGIANVDDGKAGKVLLSSGVDSKLVYDLVIKLAGRNEGGNARPQGYTPRAKNIADRAKMEANMRGYSLVEPEHLLIALLRESNSNAVKILLITGLNIDKLFTDLVNSTSSNVFRPIPMTARTGKPNAKKEGETKVLDRFSRDLTEAAAHGTLDPVIGRETEIQRVIQILSRRTKNNPVLIGEPGVGKTAVAEGLAQVIVTGEAPETLLGKRIVTLDLSGMLAGTKYRGDFEERIKTAIDEVLKAGDVILFIDELHTIIGAGAA